MKRDENKKIKCKFNFNGFLNGVLIIGTLGNYPQNCPQNYAQYQAIILATATYLISKANWFEIKSHSLDYMNSSFF